VSFNKKPPAGARGFTNKNVGLKYVVPETYIVQSANTWIAKCAAVILVEKIGSTDFHQAPDVRELVTDHGIYSTVVRNLTSAKSSFPHYFILPPVVDVETKPFINIGIGKANISAILWSVEEGDNPSRYIVQLIAVTGVLELVTNE
jgi:hypothetical protein